MDAAIARSRPRTGTGRRRPAVAAALLTVAAAVLLDVAAVAEAGHVLGLGLLAAGVGALRLHRFGREHPGVTAAASAMVVAQPAVHVAGRLWEFSAAALDPAPAFVHLTALVLHVVLAVATVLLVAAADVVVAAVMEALGRLVRLVTATPDPAVDHGTRRAPGTTPERALTPVIRAAYALRRGPPGAVRAI